MNNISISIVICSRNDKKGFVKQCLQHLINQIDHNCELVFIENTKENKFYSKKSIEKLINYKCRCRYFNVKGNFLSHSRCVALKKVNNDILIFIDDDVLVSQNLILNVRNFFSQYQNATAYVGKFFPTYTNVWSKIACLYWLQDLIFVKKLKKINFYPMACTALNMSFVTKNKLTFDKNLKTGEDIDFFIKIMKLKGKLYFDPNLSHSHIFKTNVFSFISKHLSYGASMLKLKQKYPKIYQLNEYLPTSRWQHAALPIFIFTRSLQISRRFIKTYHLSFKYWLATYLLFLSILISILFSRENKRTIHNDLHY